MIRFLMKHDWLGHIVEAVIMALLVGLTFAFLLPLDAAATLGIAFAVGHFHGREKRDYEVSEKMRPPHLKAYLLWRWSGDQQTDFWPVAVIGLVVMVLVWI